MTDLRAPAAPRPLLLPDGRPAADAWTLDPGLLHLNHGSFGGVPRAAQQRQSALRDEMERAPVVWFPELTGRIAAARAEIAAHLRTDPADLALVPNASAGVSVVHAALAARPGGDIVVTDHGYGAVTMSAARLARRWGTRVRTARVPLDADADRAHDAVMAEVDAGVALIVLDQITSATARLLPVARVGAEAARLGIPFLVDGAHAPGLLAAPLDGLVCDAWVGNLHKWGCAPRGTAALVARGPLQTELHPPIDSWSADAPFPDRFDQQGTVDATAWLAAPTALDLVETTWGWDAVRGHLDDLARYGAHVVAAALGTADPVDVGLPVPGMRLVRLPEGLAPTRIAADALRDRAPAELGAEAAFTSFDGIGYLRLSAHVYNTPTDYDRFAEQCVPVIEKWAREGTDGA
ncbi:aminotransferase class V-fold PLP-dependent enzyme [Streptomyces sp. NPDC091281]|uniref:aminotransferase class V-fold PLP-dependent enzyme n=1 Tax=Streptomyces sp. NPDC091281 TaxID=3365985 RepID=UPI0038306DDE